MSLNFAVVVVARYDEVNKYVESLSRTLHFALVFEGGDSNMGKEVIVRRCFTELNYQQQLGHK